MKFHVFLWLLLSVACSRASGPAEARHSVWLVSNGIHTSVVLRTADVPYWRQITDVRDARAIVIGWGAEGFYRGPVGIGAVFRSILPGQSVLHVIPLRKPVAQRFPHSDVVMLSLTSSQVNAFAKQLAGAFARERDGGFRLLGRGYFEHSRFYRGQEQFYFPNICNIWLASRLQRVGVRVCVPCCLLAPGLIHQATYCGRRIQVRQGPRDGF